MYPIERLDDILNLDVFLFGGVTREEFYVSPKQQASMEREAIQEQEEEILFRWKYDSNFKRVIYLCQEPTE